MFGLFCSFIDDFNSISIPCIIIRLTMSSSSDQHKDGEPVQIDSIVSEVQTESDIRLESYLKVIAEASHSNALALQKLANSNKSRISKSSGSNSKEPAGPSSKTSHKRGDNESETVPSNKNVTKASKSHQVPHHSRGSRNSGPNYLNFPIRGILKSNSPERSRSMTQGGSSTNNSPERSRSKTQGGSFCPDSPGRPRGKTQGGVCLANSPDRPRGKTQGGSSRKYLMEHESSRYRSPQRRSRSKSYYAPDSPVRDNSPRKRPRDESFSSDDDYPSEDYLDSHRSVKSKIIHQESDDSYNNPLAKGSSTLTREKGKALNKAGGHSSEDYSDSCGYDSDHSENHLDAWERSLMSGDEDPEIPSPSTSNQKSFKVIGGPANCSWEVPKDVFDWYLKVADVELKSDDLKSLKDLYTPSEESSSHFCPPRVPPSIWDNLKSSSAETYKHKTCFSAQQCVYTAIMPLLSVLSSLDDKDSVNKDRITGAIQLLCTSNLHMNRFRRALASSSVKRDLRKSLMSAPVTHDNLFNKDFSKSVDEALKMRTATRKLLQPYRSQSRFRSSGRSKYKQSDNRSYNKYYKDSDKEGSDAKSYRGKTSRGRGNRRGRGRSGPKAE